MVVISEHSSKFLHYLFRILCLVSIISTIEVEGALKRCFQCRSRGDLGSCKDPFKYNNATAIENIAGVQTIPCASGWCGKLLEGGANQFKDEEYGAATQRLCLQRGPSDNEERCAPANWGALKVQMCFCTGDLCNGSTKLSATNVLHSVLTIGLLLSTLTICRIVT